MKLWTKYCKAAARIPYRAKENKQAGNSTVEFIGAAAGLLVPALLLIVAVVRVQSASFAAESAAAEVARTYSLARHVSQAQTTSHKIAELAFGDQGLQMPAMSVSCTHAGCQTPGDIVTVTIAASVPLVAVGTWNLGYLPVQATATSYLGQYVERTQN